MGVEIELEQRVRHVIYATTSECHIGCVVCVRVSRFCTLVGVLHGREDQLAVLLIDQGRSAADACVDGVKRCLQA